MSQPQNMTCSDDTCPECGIRARMTGCTLFLCEHQLENIKARFRSYDGLVPIGGLNLIVIPEEKPDPPQKPKTFYRCLWEWLAPVMEDHQ